MRGASHLTSPVQANSRACHALRPLCFRSITSPNFRRSPLLDPISRRAWSVALVSMALCSTVLRAQAPASMVPRLNQYETREQLTAMAAEAEKQGRTSEAWLLGSRLTNGDFQEGDRILIALENTARVDTMQVRAGKVVQFAGIADLSLEGVLRSELTETLRTHLAKYLRNPALRATPLLPIAVFGNVGAPGYYYVPADVVLRDVIMRAGGPRNGDLRRVTIRRGGEAIWKPKEVATALAEGMSLDRLHLRAGDEIVVSDQRRFSASTVLSVISASTALFYVFRGFQF
jgi:protein involved in polysaccharide export with SLBB domain